MTEKLENMWFKVVASHPSFKKPYIEVRYTRRSLLFELPHYGVWLQAEVFEGSHTDHHSSTWEAYSYGSTSPRADPQSNCVELCLNSPAIAQLRIDGFYG